MKYGILIAGLCLAIGTSSAFAQKPRWKEESSFEKMSIYLDKSNRTDKEMNLLFESIIQVNDVDTYDAKASAIYYLSFFPNSRVLLPKAKKLLKEEIAVALKNYEGEIQKKIRRHSFVLGNISALFNAEGDFFLSIDAYRACFCSRRDEEDRDLITLLIKIGSLKQLIDILEFKERVPPEEWKRFDDFLCEITSIQDLLDAELRQRKVRPHVLPCVYFKLKKGDECFEIYFREYPSRYRVFFQWENEDSCYVNYRDNPDISLRKAFYERELTNPRGIYTVNQLKYIRRQVQGIEEAEEKMKETEAKKP